MPDLSSLLEVGGSHGVATYASIVLCMLGGATWDRSEGTEASRVDLPRWMLGPSAQGSTAYCLWDNGEEWDVPLPRPLTDPAAAWELEMRENCWTEPVIKRDGDGIILWLGRSANQALFVHAVPDRKRATVLTVLHKHRHGPLQHLIEPLLDKMTEED